VADHSSAHEKNGVCSTDTPSDRTSRWFGAHPSSQAVEWKDSMNLLDAHIERKILTSSMKRQVLFSFSALSIVQEFTQISESTAQDHSRRAERRPAPPIEKMSAKDRVSGTPIRDAFRYLPSLGFVDRRTRALFPPKTIITQMEVTT